MVSKVSKNNVMYIVFFRLMKSKNYAENFHNSLKRILQWWWLWWWWTLTPAAWLTHLSHYWQEHQWKHNDHHITTNNNKKENSFNKFPIAAWPAWCVFTPCHMSCSDFVVPHFDSFVCCSFYLLIYFGKKTRQIF